MDIDLEESPTSKRHKKHKKHKHKKSKHTDEDDIVDVGGVAIPAGEEVSKPAIRLKLKLGAHTVTKSVTKSSLGKTEPVEVATPEVQTPGAQTATAAGASAVAGAMAPVPVDRLRLKDDDSDIFKTKKRDDDTSDEEQAWLDALEKGELDDNGDVKKVKDESLLTARQRSLLHGKTDSLFELPSGYKNTELTEEQIKRRQQRTAKRREQARAKSEKDKKQTLDRLLKKQDSMRKSKLGRSRRLQTPGFRYINSKIGIALNVPEGVEINFKAQKAPAPPKAVLCGVSGCKNQKKYNCSTTGLPLCSLQCYKKNLSTALYVTAH